MLEVRKQLIKNHAVVDDDWSVLRLDEGDAPETVLVAQGKVIVPLTVWQAQREQLAGREHIAVWLASHERAESLRDELDRFALIAVDFPKFSDGRGYSIAYNLRKRLGYKGELRAIGDVLRDQLFQMLRTGFDAFSTRPDRNIHDALKGLTVFSETYQASIDTALPLFRRVQRGRPAEPDVAYGI
ncbi:DUF934 domain-containing protein [Massilia agilis]|uniref:DUF934 domain-containing protein n=1 Tax=Massilia agilis TaxID=1811226 RepID=A0ABT2DAY2_9BURK|nr:DUF934 domain-containing protein [Massilia agilis]MCS0808468.1 DUF934 domain-containing protein [Massilia agilis]